MVNSPKTYPLVSLRDVRKAYGGESGQPSTEVLRGVTLDIDEGEFVAIVGASGSGKSTLMHILGLLDRPTSGAYEFGGQDTRDFSPDERSRLRREAFGFVFQSYNLIASLDAQRNVEMPAIYGGMPEQARQSRAKALLERLGLAERVEHRPNQLSGGQQQRVSIARALMNGGRVILADEPTGALDTKSGKDVMELLRELADKGHTVIVITHDHSVAAQAKRVVEIRDGAVVGDTRRRGTATLGKRDASPETLVAQNASVLVEAREAVRAAWHAMWVNRFRTALTLLGIVIGVASVIVMLAIGSGTQEMVLAQLESFGTNRIYIIPDTSSSTEHRADLTLKDVDTIRDIPNVQTVMPFIQGQATLRAGNVDTSAPIWAAPPGVETVLNWHIARGMAHVDDDERDLATVVLLGKRLRERLFGNRDCLGQYVLVNNVPFQVIGELAERGAVSGDANDDNVALVPFSTGSRRVIGKTALSYVIALIDRLDESKQTQSRISKALEERRGAHDFQVFDMAGTIAAQKATQGAMTAMLGVVAAISLLVGGIGVMNIMLMTVKERTREIGIRMATGARQRDIKRQFLTEAATVSVVGGALGVALGLVIGAVLIAVNAPFIFSLRAILGAFGCALLTGLVFGYMPARQAARMEPVVALASE
jgi:macrolide transport system ATP-binding/permease protein